MGVWFNPPVTISFCLVCSLMTLKYAYNGLYNIRKKKEFQLKTSIEMGFFIGVHFWSGVSQTYPGELPMQANASQLNVLHSVMGHFSLSERITYETVEPVSWP